MLQAITQHNDMCSINSKFFMCVLKKTDLFWNEILKIVTPCFVKKNRTIWASTVLFMKKQKRAKLLTRKLGNARWRIMSGPHLSTFWQSFLTNKKEIGNFRKITIRKLLAYNLKNCWKLKPLNDLNNAALHDRWHLLLKILEHTTNSNQNKKHSRKNSGNDLKEKIAHTYD